PPKGTCRGRRPAPPGARGGDVGRIGGRPARRGSAREGAIRGDPLTAGAVDPARARGAGTHGGRVVELGDRATARARGSGGREARVVRALEARPARRRRDRAPPGAGG